MKIVTDPGGIYQEVLNDLDYKTVMGFIKKWPEYTRFVEGDQWPPPTEETKYMPRPVINICDQSIENKRSNILSQNLKMQFRVKELPVGDNEEQSKQIEEIAQNFTDMAQNTWYDIQQDTLLKEEVNDTLSLGTGVIHYYFDNSFKGGTFQKYIGKMKGEVIDPMDLILGNNQLKPYQLQMQPWFIIKRRKDFNKVVETSKKRGKDHDKIEPDNYQDPDEHYDSAKVQSKNSKEVTTYTKYFTKDNEIYWVEVTKQATVVKPTRLSPDPECKFELYPVDMLGFKRRRKCAYYRSMIEDIIPNQKALNWGLGMQLLSVQQTAWPKIIAKVNALQQQVTNTPGEILTDHAQGNDGFKYMQMPNTPATAPALTQTLLEMTRSVTGVTEVSTGEQLGANMAASAIIALQNQAQRPNDDYMNDVIAAVKRQGEIWEQFFKCFYNLPRTIKTKDEDGKDAFKTFDGTEGRGIEFDLMVDVGPSSVYSESLQIATLEQMKAEGDINKYQKIKYMPKSTIPQGLREEMEKEETELKEQQEIQQGQMDQVISQLTPEEQAEINANPELVEGLGV